MTDCLRALAAIHTLVHPTADCCARKDKPETLAALEALLDRCMDEGWLIPDEYMPGECHTYICDVADGNANQHTGP